MQTLVRIGLLVTVPLAAAACHDHHHHHHDRVVVESEALAPLQGGCVVRGTVRNDGDHTVHVFFSWRAQNQFGASIGTAEDEVGNLPPDGRRDFESSRFRDFAGNLIGCDQIARFRRSTAVTGD